MASIFAALKAVFSTFYLALILLTIPIAFDAGNEYCGLAFTFTLSVFYFFMTTIRSASRNTAFASIAHMLYYLQHIIIPLLLVVHIQIFSQGSVPHAWLSLLKPWRFVMMNATPVFTILDGICSLLTIQALGHMSKWLIREKSNLWTIWFLVSSAGIISASLYFLARAFTVPEMNIGIGSAILLGSIITYCCIIGIYGIVSERGTALESSLLFAYIVRCIYETFPELAKSTSESVHYLVTQTTATLRQEILNIPILTDVNKSFSGNYYSGDGFASRAVQLVLSSVSTNVPNSFSTVYNFLVAATGKVTLPVVFNLAYRVGVFYSATRIIPAIQSSSNRVSVTYHSSDDESSESRAPQAVQTPRRRRRSRRAQTSRRLEILYAYAPCIIIAVYTHYLMQHAGLLKRDMWIWGWWNKEEEVVNYQALFNDDAGYSSLGSGEFGWRTVVLVHAWEFWNWVNMISMLALYTSELVAQGSVYQEPLSVHWKSD